MILEALSCGCPILAAPAGGIPEIVNKSTGILVSPTVPELEKVLTELLQHPKRVEELSQNCRREAEKIGGLKNAGIIENTYKVFIGHNHAL